MKRIVWAAVIASAFSLLSIIMAAQGKSTEWVLATGLAAITYAILATRD